MFGAVQDLSGPSALDLGCVLPALDGQTGLGPQQIVESQQQRQPLPVLVLAALLDLVIAEVPFQVEKRMLHFGLQRGLGPIHPGFTGSKLRRPRL